MASIAWILYAVLLIGPYIAILVVIVAVGFVAVRYLYRRSPVVGFVLAVIMLVAISYPLVMELGVLPNRFGRLCQSEVMAISGTSVPAQNYALVDLATTEGHFSQSGATTEDAIRNVAAGRVQFVEVYDSDSPNFQDKARTLWLSSIRPHGKERGFFRFHLSQYGTDSCLWDSHFRKSHADQLRRDINSLLDPTTCISVEYVPATTAQYIVDTYVQNSDGFGITKFAVRVRNIDDPNKSIGERVAFQLDQSNILMTGIFSVVRRSHTRCPLNLLEGDSLAPLLKLRVPPRPNPRFEGTTEKLRFSVPSALRAPAAPQAERWASSITE